MSTDSLSIAVSGLLASQTAINTASQNIANVNTEGFSRQRVDIDSRNPIFFGGNFLGVGAEVGAVTRIVDNLVLLEIQANTAGFNELDTFLSQANQINNLIADEATGVTGALQDIFSAVQNVANDPAAASGRQVLLAQSRSLAQRFNTIYSQFNRQSENLNQTIDTLTREVTILGQTIADLNVQISSVTGGGRGQPNDLLDRRDNAINQLAELVDISRVPQGDQINIYIGTGQALVVGASTTSIVSQVDPIDPRGREIILQSGAGGSPITEFVTGGKLGGLLRFKNEVLDTSFNTLGKVALGIAQNFNDQHQLGMDQNNSLGGLFFGDINTPDAVIRRVSSDLNNAGNAQIGLTIDDVNLLSNADYELQVTGGNYVLTNLDTNAVVATIPVPAVTPTNVAVAADGFTLNFQSGTPVDGDRFRIFPTRDGGADINVAINDIRQIASALPVQAQASISNIGNGSVVGVSVTDTSTAQFTNVPQNLDPPIQIEFLSGTTFNVRDANTNAIITGPVAGYVPNSDNDMLALAGLSYGYEITINGAPQAGDTFDVTYNTDGFGDNRNILQLGLLQQVQTLDGGNSSFQESFSRLVSDIGIRTQEAKVGRDAQDSLLNQAKNRRNEISGVNLDEEAANLIRFQQAYQASAQVISVTRTIFDTIINTAA